MELQNHTQERQHRPFLNTLRQKQIKGYTQGVILTLLITMAAAQITKLPFFSIMGIMIISILSGMSWKSLMGVQSEATIGIGFTSKYLLRLGIILMGIRLNLQQIFEAGLSIILIDGLVIIFTLVVMMYLGRLFKIDKYLSALIAVGTAVCGAAAIVAVASVIKSKKEFTALAVACIAILGTVGALGYIFIYPSLEIDPQSYGVLVGATLHELAHVIAASVPGGELSIEGAILTKLGRVALLIPVAFVFGYMFTDRSKESIGEKKLSKLPIPWFIFGFLAMSLVNTFNLLSVSITDFLVEISVYLLAMAMAGLGLSINFGDFKQVGFKPVLVGILGFIALSAIGPLLLLIM